MVTQGTAVRLLARADLWIHGVVAVGALAALATGPFLQSPGLAESVGVGHGAASHLHAVGAALAVLGGLLHLSRLCLAWLGGRSGWGLLPSAGDLKELLQALAFGAGLAGTAPAWGRFSYREKVPYLAFLAGLPAAALTGFAAGQPTLAVGVVGPEGLVAAASLHSALGLLLVPFLLWHLFFVHWHPDLLFWNGAWLTGTTTWERVERTHPGWARELSEGPAPAPVRAEAEAASVEEHLVEGNRAAREGRYEEAERAYLEALRLYPGYAQALFNLGVARWRAGNGPGAREALTRFLEQDPFNPMAERVRQMLHEIGGDDGPG